MWGGEGLFGWNVPVWEHDLADGLRLLHNAVDTHLIASHFALPLLIRRPGGLVVEMTDGTRDYNDTRYRNSTFYDLAKASVLRLAFAQGMELAPHGCTALALTPGWLRSEMMLEAFGVTEATWRDAPAAAGHFAAISESPRYVGRAIAALAADPDVARRNGGSFSSGELAREYGFTDVDGSQPDCWRYLVEVQDAGTAGGPDRLPLTWYCAAGRTWAAGLRGVPVVAREDGLPRAPRQRRSRRGGQGARFRRSLEERTPPPDEAPPPTARYCCAAPALARRQQSLRSCDKPLRSFVAAGQGSLTPSYTGSASPQGTVGRAACAPPRCTQAIE